MTRFKDYHVPSTACPYCAKPLDAAFKATPDDPSPPVGGDITLCLGCGEWCIFDDDMTLRTPTDAEQLELSHDPRCIMARTVWNEMQAAINEGAV